MTIKKDSIFIADSHYNNKRTILSELLDKIDSKKIQTSQIFLMGDIFDFLCDEVDYFQNVNKKPIELINKLSEDIEIIYFEGNHDFSLKKTFKKLQLIPREQQPFYLEINNKKVALSHGDIFTPKGYNIFTKIFRTSYLLKFLNLIDVNNFFSKLSQKRLKEKNICRKQKDFEKFIKKRVKDYDVDLVIEGHYHQKYFSKNYINLPSLACHKEYMQFDGNEFKFIKV